MKVTQQRQIRYTIERDGYSFSDAIYYEESAVVGMTEEQVLTMATPLMEQRFANWKAAVEAARNAPPPPEPDPQFTVTNEDGTVTNA